MRVPQVCAPSALSRAVRYKILQPFTRIWRGDAVRACRVGGHHSSPCLPQLCCGTGMLPAFWAGQQHGQGFGPRCGSSEQGTALLQGGQEEGGLAGRSLPDPEGK